MRVSISLDGVVEMLSKATKIRVEDEVFTAEKGRCQECGRRGWLFVGECASCFVDTPKMADALASNAVVEILEWIDTDGVCHRGE